MLPNGQIWEQYSQISLFPLGGSGSGVPSFQLRPVSRATAKRVPPSDATSRLVGLGGKSRDGFKDSFQAQGVGFSLLPQRARRAAFGSSMAPKTPASKLNRPFARKPPAIASFTRTPTQRILSLKIGQQVIAREVPIVRE